MLPTVVTQRVSYSNPVGVVNRVGSGSSELSASGACCHLTADPRNPRVNESIRNSYNLHGRNYK